jgi:hypothetical protein
METMLETLVGTARREQAVASQVLENDMTMTVYPDEGNRLLVLLGYSGEHAHRAPAEQLVRKRSGNLPRYGAWLPMQFLDGGIYVAARTVLRSDDSPVISADELAVAEELLS